MVSDYTKPNNKVTADGKVTPDNSSAGKTSENKMPDKTMVGRSDQDQSSRDQMSSKDLPPVFISNASAQKNVDTERHPEEQV